MFVDLRICCLAVAVMLVANGSRKLDAQENAAVAQATAEEPTTDTKAAEDNSAESKPDAGKPEAAPAAAAQQEEKKPGASEKSSSEKSSPENSPEAPANTGEKADQTAAPEDALPPIRKLPGIGQFKTHPIPGLPWGVHDLLRPRPPVVQPGETPMQAPADAIVLFDGKDLSQWCHRGKQPGELFAARWKVQDGYFEVTGGTGSIYTLDSFGSCQLHIEWASPEQVKGDSQGRGNSGIKIMERFEVQVLDSFNNRTYSDGQAASLYGQYPPLVNAVKPPGQWQVYDIFFEAPRFENEQLVSPAYVTVVHNGILVHHHRELKGPTGGGRSPSYSYLQPAAPLMLQDHGNPVRYRNIWIREL